MVDTCERGVSVRGFGVFSFFFFLFGPDSLLSLWCCCVFSFLFFSFLSSMSCEFFYTLVRVVRAQHHDKQLATRQGTYNIVLNVRFNLF
ncbi:hypothetical protein AAZX31_14G072900 [Glycine max]